MNNIVLKTYPKHEIINNGYYRIPIEWLNNCNDKYLLNQILSKNRWIYQRRLVNYLDKLGYTIQDYYDRWILNITVPSDRPKCKYCNKSLRFSGRISRGYSETGGHDQLFCSYRCYIDYRNSHRLEYFQMNAYKDRGRLIHNTKGISKLYLYIQIFGDRFKIGASSNFDFKYGRYDNQMPLEYNDINSIYLFEGNRRSIIKCEYKSKLLSKDSCYPELIDEGTRGSTEIFKIESLNDVLKYIGTYKFHRIR